MIINSKKQAQAIIDSMLDGTIIYDQDLYEDCLGWVDGYEYEDESEWRECDCRYCDD